MKKIKVIQIVTKKKLMIKKRRNQENGMIGRMITQKVVETEMGNKLKYIVIFKIIINKL